MNLIPNHSQTSIGGSNGTSSRDTSACAATAAGGPAGTQVIPVGEAPYVGRNPAVHWRRDQVLQGPGMIPRLKKSRFKNIASTLGKMRFFNLLGCSLHKSLYFVMLAPKRTILTWCGRLSHNVASQSLSFLRQLPFRGLQMGNQLTRFAPGPKALVVGNWSALLQQAPLIREAVRLPLSLYHLIHLDPLSKTKLSRAELVSKPGERRFRWPYFPAIALGVSPGNALGNAMGWISP